MTFCKKVTLSNLWFACGLLVILLMCTALVGCGDVGLATLDAGDPGKAGAGGSAGGAGGGSAGSAAGAGDVGGGGSGGTAGTGGAPCVENTRQDCRTGGAALLTAYVNCMDQGFAATPTWGTCGGDGKISDGDYRGLICPFDVAAEVFPLPPAVSCADAECAGSIFSDSVGWYAWRNTTETIYCCDSTVVRKIARCK